MSTRRMASGIFAAAIIGIGCRVKITDELSANVGTPLIDGFVSRSGTVEVERTLRQGNAKIEVIEDSEGNNGQSSLGSTLSLRVLNVADFTYLGVNGELRLEFVNNELMATWFFPEDVSRFEAETVKRWPAAGSGQPIRLQTATELRGERDFRRKRYWAWEDVNLREKVEHWIKRRT